MSDLQCPARLYLASAGQGDDSHRWSDTVARESIAGVVDLRGSGSAVQHLLEVADLHRGEAVLVLLHPSVAAPWGLSAGECEEFWVDGDGIRRAAPPPE